jgi:phosphatidylinositol kinase/protein kinase (PI-3  family)
VLKYEPYHDCALSRFLLHRALKNPLIGHSFFWYLKSEMDVPEISERYGLLLEVYLRGCGSHMAELLKQNQVLKHLVRAANLIKNLKENERKESMLSELEKIKFPAKFQLPLNPKMEASGVLLNKCKYMDSKKLPLFLAFSNADPHGNPIYVIFKSGDDLRQDMLTLQMLRLMDGLWQSAKLDLRMSCYGCIATGDGVGMIEVVLNAETTAHIHIQAGGASAALFKSDTLANWIRHHNPKDEEYKVAVNNFIRSCAGYCVATYVLGIGDRHNDNVMMTKSGKLFHIDFGHFLGNYKKKFGIKRERAPFVFTHDFAYVMGGKDTPDFLEFVGLCCDAYNVLRNHASMFINLFAMMLSTGIPELQDVEDITYLRDAFMLDLTEEKAREHFRALIYESLDTKTTLFNNAIHILARMFPRENQGREE